MSIIQYGENWFNWYIQQGDGSLHDRIGNLLGFYAMIGFALLGLQFLLGWYAYTVDRKDEKMGRNMKWKRNRKMKLLADKPHRETRGHDHCCCHQDSNIEYGAGWW